MRALLAGLAFVFASACAMPVKVEPTQSAPASCQTFVGKMEGQSYDKAVAMADEQGFAHRLVYKDGQNYRVTRDYRPERINFSVQDNRVVQATCG